MPLHIIREDITRMKVDAIVAAGSARPGVPTPTGGVNGSIHRKAGARLIEALRRLGGIRTGSVTLTAAYNLPCKYVIHTAGPVWKGGTYGEETLLRACYREALQLAVRKRLSSIAFPLISTGRYGYPKAAALQAATSEIRAFLQEYELEVYLVVYDREAFAVSSELFAGVQAFIDQHYVDEHRTARNTREEDWAAQYNLPPHLRDVEQAKAPLQRLKTEKYESWESPDMLCAPFDTLLVSPEYSDKTPEPPDPLKEQRENKLLERLLRELRDEANEADDLKAERPAPMQSPQSAPKIGSPVQRFESPRLASRSVLKSQSRVLPKAALSLEERLRQLDEGFSQALLRLIDEKGMKDSACYRKANVDRKLFNKIKNTPGYTPKKSTVMAFCVALELDMPGCRELLSRAGYALSRSSMFDVIVEYYIGMGTYDVDAINQALFAYDQPLLGSNVG